MINNLIMILKIEHNYINTQGTFLFYIFLCWYDVYR